MPSGEEVVIFAPCSYTGANKGDAALVEAMAAALRRELGDVRLVLTSFTPERDARRYGLTVLRMPLPLDGRIAARLHHIATRGQRRGRVVAYVVAAQVAIYVLAMRMAIAVGDLAPRVRCWLVPPAHSAIVEAIRSARVVAAVPGGYLMAPTPGHYHWLYHVATLALCSMFGRSILLLPGSYGPFPGLHRHVAAKILSRCDVIMVREQASAKAVAALGIAAERIHIVPDTAFLLPDGDGVGELDRHGLGWSADKEGLIGVSVMRYDFPQSAHPREAMERYVDSVAKAMDRCIEQLGATPVFVSQVRGDGEVSATVVDQMRSGHRAVIVDADLSPFGLKALYGRFDLMVGTRAHANVIAMASGVPAVAISYQPKGEGIMQLAGFGRYVVPIDNPGTLTSVVEEAWHRRHATRRELARVLPELRRAAGEAAGMVAAACRESSGRAGPQPR